MDKNESREKRKSKVYSRELKIKACNDVLSGRLTVTEANKKYEIRSTSAISRWCYQLGFLGNKSYNHRPAKYNEEFKKDVANDVFIGKLSVAEACREYGIPSATSITGWLKEYHGVAYKDVKVPVVIEGKPNLGKVRDIIMPKNTSTKSLQEEIAQLKKELEQALLEAEVNAKVVEIASQELGIDIRKKSNTKQSKS